jgi:signal transduction histidine kinase
MRTLSFRSQLLLLMVVPVLATTAALGGLAYRAASEAVSQNAIRAVGIAANAREQALVMRLYRQHERASALLDTTADCAASKGPERVRCLREALDDFVATEGVRDARLVVPGLEPLLVGAEAPSLAELTPLPSGQLVRVEPKQGHERVYEMLVQRGGRSLGLRFAAAVHLEPLFRDRYGLGGSGETFLADSQGVFITQPRYPGHSGESQSHPIDARPMRECLSGRSAEILAPDYRDVGVIHGFRFIEEIGGGCIMAHIEQAEAFAPVRTLRARLAEAAVVLAALAVVLSFVFARRFSRPVSLLTDRARALQGGALDIAVPAEGPRELKTFAETFTKMARSLQEATEERERLLREVRAERTRLEVLAREAQEAARIREDLVAVVSHDLRNPISAISMSASVMLKREGLQDWQAKGLSRIYSAADRAIRLIRDLLDSTQARVGGIPVERRPLDFHELARHVVEEVQLAHPERHIHFQPGGDAHGAWDGDRMAQVITNLVGNAVQHSPADTPIRVRSHGDDGVVLLEIHNEGPPIPAETLPTLFEPFQRGRSTRGGAPGSLGLGLFISRQLVEAHGGTIEVRSAQGEGTTFTVRLPRASPAAATAP